ncbi:DoxX family protein [Streptomyces capitiformicae]|uniref:DoxX family protein n=1 Tax=Streptomyces capitiformicae TaxID=2014920 RepID=A0A919DNR5_9ACTN|nr:DoxX family protein [Streptomyces capitiformicae]GHE66986.1 hypothetical protein GCM10017771_90670 [Streptomyces capitiformicae]
MPHARFTLPIELGLPELRSSGSAASLVARLAAGTIILGHGLEKLADPQGFQGLLRNYLGIAAPEVLGWLVVVGEPLAGLALVVGLLSRAVAVVMTFHIGLAIAMVARTTGFLTPHDGREALGAGYEFHILLVALLFVVLSTGPGPLSLDRLLGLEPHPGQTGRLTPTQVAAAYALACAVVCTVLAVVVNGSLIGMPSGEGRNTLHHAFTGLVAGLLAGFAALFVHQKRTARTAPDTARTSPLPAAVKAALTGGVAGAVMSALINHLLIGMPAAPDQNTANHAITALISGFLSAFVGLLFHQRSSAHATGTTEREAGPSSRAVTGKNTAP